MMIVYLLDNTSFINYFPFLSHSSMPSPALCFPKKLFALEPLLQGQLLGESKLNWLSSPKFALMKNVVNFEHILEFYINGIKTKHFTLI